MSIDLMFLTQNGISKLEEINQNWLINRTCLQLKILLIYTRVYHKKYLFKLNWSIINYIFQFVYRILFYNQEILTLDVTTLINILYK